MGIHYREIAFVADKLAGNTVNRGDAAVDGVTARLVAFCNGFPGHETPLDLLDDGRTDAHRNSQRSRDLSSVESGARSPA